MSLRLFASAATAEMTADYIQNLQAAVLVEKIRCRQLRVYIAIWQMSFSTILYIMDGFYCSRSLYYARRWYRSVQWAGSYCIMIKRGWYIRIENSLFTFSCCCCRKIYVYKEEKNTNWSKERSPKNSWIFMSLTYFAKERKRDRTSLHYIRHGCYLERREATRTTARNCHFVAATKRNWSGFLNREKRPIISKYAAMLQAVYISFFFHSKL